MNQPINTETQRNNLIQLPMYLVLTIMMMLVFSSCGITTPNWFNTDPKNLGSPTFKFGTNPSLTIPTEMENESEANWVVTWQGGTAPYQVAWHFGGGASNIGLQDETSPVDQTVLMVNTSTEIATFTCTVTVVDAQGYANSSTGVYSVAPNEQ